MCDSGWEGDYVDTDAWRTDLDAMQLRAEKAEAACAAFRAEAERDALQTERDTARVLYDASTRRHHAIAAERDALRAQVERLTAALRGIHPMLPSKQSMLVWGDGKWIDALEMVEDALADVAKKEGATTRCTCDPSYLATQGVHDDICPARGEHERGGA